MPSFQLVVRRGPKAGEKFPLETQTVIIGRDSTADIHLNDPEVSRNHCRLILDQSSYYLQDLGSTNGTFVDGTRLTGEPIDLDNGQIIQLGSNVTLLYQEFSDEGDVMATMFSVPSSTPADDSTSLYDYQSDPEISAIAEEPEEITEDPPIPVPSPPVAKMPPPPAVTETYDDEYEDDEEEEKSWFQKNRIMVISIIVAIVLLCCICMVIGGGAYYYYQAANFLGSVPQ